MLDRPCQLRHTREFLIAGLAQIKQIEPRHAGYDVFAIRLQKQPHERRHNGFRFLGPIADIDAAFV